MESPRGWYSGLFSSPSNNLTLCQLQRFPSDDAIDGEEWAVDQGAHRLVQGSAKTWAAGTTKGSRAAADGCEAPHRRMKNIMGCDEKVNVLQCQLKRLKSVNQCLRSSKALSSDSSNTGSSSINTDRRTTALYCSLSGESDNIYVL